MKIDFKSIAKTVANTYNSNKAEIFTGAGIVLMVGATATAVVATVKTMKAASDKKAEKLTEIAVDAESYEQLTEEEQRRYDEIVNNPVPAKELAPIVWKYWMIPILMEVLGAIASIKSNRISAGKITGLAAALGYQIAENSNVREAVKEVVGEKKTEEIEKVVVERRAGEYLDEEGKPLAVIDTGTGNDLFFDYYGGRYFLSSMNFIEKQINELNFYRAEQSYSDPFDVNYTTLNDFYDLIPKLGRTGCGDDYGWENDNRAIQLIQSDDNAHMLASGTFYYVIRFKYGYGSGFKALNRKV